MAGLTYGLGVPVEMQHSESILVSVPPEQLYDLVSDIARTGEWSPICTGCTWEDGAGPLEGAWFTGRNQARERTWETRSRVVVADRGREFAWLVGDGLVRWGYTFEPENGSTRLTESWEFRPEGLAMFRERYAGTADVEIKIRADDAHASIPVTLAAIKRVAESDKPSG